MAWISGNINFYLGNNLSEKECRDALAQRDRKVIISRLYKVSG